MNLNLLEIEEIVKRALSEDIGTGDITTAVTIPSSSVSTARIIAKEDGIICGLPVAALVFSLVARNYGIGVSNGLHCNSTQDLIRQIGSSFGASDTITVTVKHGAPAPHIRTSEGRKEDLPEGRELRFAPKLVDGCSVSQGETMAEIIGPTAVILTAERTALNFMQRMSGIATKTYKLVEMVRHTSARVVDTRKTTPGLRMLEKYAVRCGEGHNNRFGLYDAVLIKDNHIQACGGIVEAINRAKAGAPHTIKIEVEADTLDQVRKALDARADMILLDNMPPEVMREAVELCKGRAITEASGGITEETIREVAEAGVDLISMGALTHSVKAMDLSLDIVG